MYILDEFFYPEIKFFLQTFSSWEKSYLLTMKMIDIENNRQIIVVQNKFRMDGSFSRCSAKRRNKRGTKSSYANNINIKIPINIKLIII